MVCSYSSTSFSSAGFCRYRDEVRRFFQFGDAIGRGFAFHFDVAILQVVVDTVVVWLGCWHNSTQKYAIVAIMPIIDQNTPFDSIRWRAIFDVELFGGSSAGILIAPTDDCRLSTRLRFGMILFDALQSSGKSSHYRRCRSCSEPTICSIRCGRSVSIGCAAGASAAISFLRSLPSSL